VDAPSSLEAATPIHMTKEAFAYTRLRELIGSAKLPVGAHLNGRVLAHDLGISQIPIREAIKRLAAEGLVRIQPHVGAFVNQLPIQAQVEYLEIRQVLEELAIARVTTAGDVDLSEAHDILHRIDAAIEAEDWEACSVLNREFHHALYTKCGNTSLVEEIDRLFALTELGQRLNLWNTAKAAESQRDHRELLASIAAGNEATARALMREHRRPAIEFLAGLANETQGQREADDVASTQ
jgi:DNA-binding GntR family transcriptional regulator